MPVMFDKQKNKWYYVFRSGGKSGPYDTEKEARAVTGVKSNKSKQEPDDPGETPNKP
ncbi:hypothetical protein D3C75_710980 [compost metagenome]